MGEAVEVIPEAPAEVRELAYAAFCRVQATFDGSARSARARARIRSIKSHRGIAGLPPDLRALWKWHVENQAGFASLPFDLQQKEFMALQAEDAVPGLGIPPRRGRRGHDAFHLAGAPLLAWWQREGRTVTANLGPNRSEPTPSDTVAFLAAEFARIAERYGDAALLIDGEEHPDAEASDLRRRVAHP